MKHILITGATRGLGRVLATGFAETGWAVSGCGTSREDIDSLASTLGDDHLVMPCDVTNESHVAKFCEAAIERFGPPDLLVNNAAIINPSAPLWEVSPADFSQVIDVNLKGVHHMIFHVLPSMIARGKGIVINLSSGWGRSTSPEVAAYCCTKFGIEGLTKALAKELPPGLAAIPLNPGVIDTRMLRSCWGEGAGSSPSPAEWAKVAVPFIQSLTVAQNGESLTVC